MVKLQLRLGLERQAICCDGLHQERGSCIGNRALGALYPQGGHGAKEHRGKRRIADLASAQPHPPLHAARLPAIASHREAGYLTLYLKSDLKSEPKSLKPTVFWEGFQDLISGLDFRSPLRQI